LLIAEHCCGFIDESDIRMIEDRIDERLCRRLLSRRKGQAVQRHGKAVYRLA
jgi:hypothetical protein